MQDKARAINAFLLDTETAGQDTAVRGTLKTMSMMSRQAYSIGQPDFALGLETRNGPIAA